MAAARSHPEEVRKFYKLVDEFHRMWDVVTEFDSLSNLASQMVPVSGAGRWVSSRCAGCATANSASWCAAVDPHMSGVHLAGECGMPGCSGYEAVAAA